MLSKKIIWQLYPSYLLIAVIVALLVSWFHVNTFQQLDFKHSLNSLEVEARWLQSQLDSAVASGDPIRIAQQSQHLATLTKHQITIVSGEGTVLNSNATQPEVLQEMLALHEIQQALVGQVIRQKRLSSILHEKIAFVIIPVDSSSPTPFLIHLMVPLKQLANDLSRQRITFLFISLLIGFIASWIGLYWIKNLPLPLLQMKDAARAFAKGELSRRLLVTGPQEMVDVAKSLNKMAAFLNDRIQVILQQRNEHQAILASMREGVLAVDLKREILSINISAARLFDVEPARALGHTLDAVIRNKDLQNFIEETFLGQASSREFTMYQQGERYLQANGTLLRDAMGGCIGVLIVLNDLTLMRQIEMAQKDFVANVSHELRTPIASMKGAVATLLDDDVSPAQSNFLKMIERNANRLEAIIEDLLTLARIEQGVETASVQRSSQRLKPVLESAIQTCQVRAQPHQTKILLECDDTMEANINAALIEQTIVNLINNAIQYSPECSTITVRSRCVPDYAEIDVLDQGYGIAPHHLSRLFDRFYRTDASRSRKVGGTGLGLAIVRHIILAHQGTVSVKSTEGQGSCFTLHLPLGNNLSQS